jgi:hypothetical protein
LCRRAVIPPKVAVTQVKVVPRIQAKLVWLARRQEWFLRLLQPRQRLQLRNLRQAVHLVRSSQAYLAQAAVRN